MPASKKINEFIAFDWLVPQEGYQWAEADEMYTPPRGPYGWAPAKRWLVRCPAAQNSEPRRYNPLEDERALFRTFVDTPTTEEAILEFATQYGWLGVLTGVYPKEALTFSPIERLSEDLLGPNMSG